MNCLQPELGVGVGVIVILGVKDGVTEGLN